VCRPLSSTRVYILQPFYYNFTDIDYCINHTCQNGASCVDGLHNYSCKCPTGYTGSKCETGRFFYCLLATVILFSLLNLYYLIIIILFCFVIQSTPDNSNLQGKLK